MLSSVAIIIVTWNKRADVLKLLDSLQAVAGDGTRVIVVDNASTDGSAEAIRNHPLSVTLLENAENLGGSGGFNTGIRFALEQGVPGYLWLLDNDAEVTPATLSKMLEVMERDPAIGIVGSCIASPEDHGLIVEAGGFVDAGCGAWRPNRRYERYEPSAGRGVVEDVDYVPACSALVRGEVFAQAGLLDERFFLHWDDIDFCTRVRAAGYRVVSAVDSVVYHGAEKGHSRMTLYYDFRNALLFFTKHGGGLPRAAVFFSILKRYLVSYVYLLLSGHKVVAEYLRDGLRDYLRGGFGRAGTPPGALTPEAGGEEIPLDALLAGGEKVIVFATGSYDEVRGVIRALQQEGSGSRTTVAVAVAADRAEAYRLPGVSRLITFDLAGDSLLQKLRVAAEILRGRFDLGITAGSSFTLPYAFLVGRNLAFDGRSGTFRATGVSRRSCWIIPCAMVGGLFLSLLSFPSVLAAARKSGEGASGDRR